MKKTEVLVIIDGGSKGNGTAEMEGYYSIQVRANGKPVLSTMGGEKKTTHRVKLGSVTNQRAELAALVAALVYSIDLIGKTDKVETVRIATDSEYCARWYSGANKKVGSKNADLIDEIIALRTPSVRVEKIGRQFIKEVLGH